MATNVVYKVIAVRGAGNSFEEADANADARLDLAAGAVLKGAIPKDPGVAFHQDDPGGGPCIPAFIDIPVNVSETGLPEAEPRGDEDDD